MPTVFITIFFCYYPSLIFCFPNIVREKVIAKYWDRENLGKSGVNLRESKFGFKAFLRTVAKAWARSSVLRKMFSITTISHVDLQILRDAPSQKYRSSRKLCIQHSFQFSDTYLLFKFFLFFFQYFHTYSKMGKGNEGDVELLLSLR